MSAQDKPSEEPSQNEAAEEESLLDHEYDGIREYDNPMPRWWTRIYWGSVVFSLAYLFHYWAGNGISVADDYQAEMDVVNAERAKEAMNQKVSEESLAQVMASKDSVTAGNAIFQAKCAACHLDKGQGSIGANLTDNSWIYGRGTLMEIYHTVSEGAQNGMPAWNRQLTPAELRQVVAFVGTLRGTNVAGKEPQGTVVE